MITGKPLIRTAGLLAALLVAPQTSFALKLLTEENPPLNYTENKKLTGMATEIVQEMGKRANVKLDFEVMAWEEGYRKAQADKETCIYSTARLGNRENLFKWVGPIAVNRWGVYGLSGFKAPIKSIQDLRQFRIGGVERDAKTEYLKQNGVTNIFEEDNDKANPPKLTLNRKENLKIDLWVTSVATAKKVAQQAKVSDIKLVYVVKESESYLACSPRTQPATLKALQEAADSMKKDGSYEKIHKAYESQ
jgi:polar amino acid transport system substrate-binding protein